MHKFKVNKLLVLFLILIFLSLNLETVADSQISERDEYTAVNENSFSFNNDYEIDNDNKYVDIKFDVTIESKE